MESNFIQYGPHGSKHLHNIRIANVKKAEVPAYGKHLKLFCGNDGRRYNRITAVDLSFAYSAERKRGQTGQCSPYTAYIVYIVWAWYCTYTHMGFMHRDIMCKLFCVKNHQLKHV